MAEDPTDITVHVDGRDVPARRGELLIEVCERAGSFVPRFCYHRRLDPVGICRMCLVEVESPRGTTLQPACFINVTDGLVAHTGTDKVKKAQDGIIEFLLANHPLDCPVCDKGGECPLQDQTLAHGSGETRFIEEKRHFAKPIPIGELVLLDRERCIQCARCTRFASEIAGEATIDFAGRGDQIEVAAFPTEPFDSVFSGNTVQICPVGALTARPYRFTARPWDLEQVESTCTTCAVGCRIAVQSSGDRLTRVLGVDADGVNQGWLCDKGRFAIGAIEAVAESDDPLDPATRIAQPLVRQNGTLEPATWGEALARAAEVIADGAAIPGGLGAIGGAALTNEGAYSWRLLLRGALGTEHLDAQYGDGLSADLFDELPRATIDDAARARTVLTLTGDLREELPVLFLRLRRALATGATQLVELSPARSALGALAAVRVAMRPGEAAELARALAGEPGATASLATNPHGAAVSDDALARARTLLADGTGVVVVLGRPNVAESAAIVEAAARTLHAAFPYATFLAALRRANVHGAQAMGLRPGRGGRDAVAQLRALADGTQRSLVLLGGGLTGNLPDRDLVSRALARARVVAVSGHGCADWASAEVVLPAAVAHERSGTVTNLEGRVSDVQAKVSAPSGAWDDVAIAGELARVLGHDLGVGTPEEAGRAIEAALVYPAATVLAGRPPNGVVPGRGRGPAGVPMDPISFPGVLQDDFVRREESGAGTPWPALAPREGAGPRAVRVDVPIADAYSLRVVAARKLYDTGAAVAATVALRPLVSSFAVAAHPHDLDRIGAKTGDRVRVVTPRGAFSAAVVADPAVTRGTAVVPLGVRGAEEPGALLFDADALVTEIRLDSA